MCRLARVWKLIRGPIFKGMSKERVFENQVNDPQKKEMYMPKSIMNK